ncbi:MAG: hypothetical protein ACI8PZ_004231 [Myxococcota bacterium]
MTAWRLGNAVWGALLLLGALVQLNDPDPLVWVVAYSVPAALCAAAIADRLAYWLPALWAAGALFWAATIAAAGVTESNPMRGPSGLFESGLLAEEIVRESLGLGLIAAGCLVQAWRIRRANA